jgi:UDP-N-acetylglucosamine acyltransferase
MSPFTGAPRKAGKNVIGNNNFIMAYAHIAHDCTSAIPYFGNGATLAGHIAIEDYAIIAGLTWYSSVCQGGAQRFCRGLLRSHS